jgi:hypothetical protein
VTQKTVRQRLRGSGGGQADRLQHGRFVAAVALAQLVEQHEPGWVVAKWGGVASLAGDGESGVTSGQLQRLQVRWTSDSMPRSVESSERHPASS